MTCEELIKKELCLGCVGLAEKDWVGAKQCNTYKEFNNISGLDLCKRILRGEQIEIQIRNR